ncbi:DUF885 family protein [uncultured Sphingomonas sp.]|uniref:DUF885 family protein n=1 Tax=uncultured Sphingomonas sp. TaxID=158754 RepID=UPI0035C94DAC
MRHFAALLLAAALPGLSVAQTPPVARAQDEGAKLRRLFAESDEANLKRNPIQALLRGDLRYADRIGESLTDAYELEEQRAVERNLQALRGIDRAKLSAVDRIAFDVFRTDNEIELRGYTPAVRRITDVLPVNHFRGFQTFYPEIASGEGGAPFKTVADYENNLLRNAQYAQVLDRMIVRARAGMARGITPPKLVVRNVIGQIDNLLAGGVQASLFYAPVKTFPDAVPAADRARLTAAYARQVRDVLNPAHGRLRAFLQDEYLPRARAIRLACRRCRAARHCTTI